MKDYTKYIHEHDSFNLHLQNAELTDDDMPELCKFLQSRFIMSVFMGNNQITDKGAQILLAYKKTTPIPIAFHFHDNKKISQTTLDEFIQEDAKIFQAVYEKMPNGPGTLGIFASSTPHEFPLLAAEKKGQSYHVYRKK